jgi:hypothetical protein
MYEELQREAGTYEADDAEANADGTGEESNLNGGASIINGRMHALRGGPSGGDISPGGNNGDPQDPVHDNTTSRTFQQGNVMDDLLGGGASHLNGGNLLTSLISAR